jgi:hypothetical protein
MGLDGGRALFKMLCSLEEQNTDRPLLRRVMDAAIDCDQSNFLYGLT